MTIADIILDYCQGTEHLEFNKSDLDEMTARIKALVVDTIIDDAEHLDDARNNVQYM